MDDKQEVRPATPAGSRLAVTWASTEASRCCSTAERPSPLELKRILARHIGWLANPKGESIPAAPLPDRDTYLESGEHAYPNWRNEARNHPEQANLYGANLSNVNLADACLRGVDLTKANLSGADLRNANLQQSYLIDTDLSGAKLRGANMTNAHLIRANLSGADMTHATLVHTKLINVNIAEARLAYANLMGATYAPSSEPPHAYVVGIKGLSTVRFPSGEQIGLVQLRKLLQDAGLRDLEREITCCIERNRAASKLAALRKPGITERWSDRIAHIARELPSAAGAALRMIAFDLTTAYGLYPLRALSLIAVFWLLLVPVYSWSILHDLGRHEQITGIYKVLPANRIGDPTTNPQIRKEIEFHRIQATGWLDSIPMASYFSLLAAANIGFQQFTPGDWIRRLQPHEYSLQAEGWIRIVAGMQALLSVYLLAMWVLTQFGRPFQ